MAAASTGSWVARDGLLVSSFFEGSGIVAGFTTRALGSMAGSRRPPAEQAANRRALAERLGFRDVVRIAQVHGTTVVRLDEPAAAPPEADAVWTTRSAVLLGIAAADCVPVLVADPAGPLGAAHAGWAGTSLGIATALVRALAAAGGWTSRMIATVGPSIGPCCYTIPPERAALVRERLGAEAGESVRVRADGALVLDLWTANAAQLVAAGVPRVEIAGVCTQCGGADLWSSRAAAGRHEGTGLAFLGRPL